jgi:hypothetical protein
MKIASRDALIQLCQRRYAEIELSDVGVVVRIQSLSEKEKSDYETVLISKNGRGILKDRLADATRRLIALCVVDENDKRVFTDNDLSVISSMDAAVASRIYDACQEHCGFNRGDIEGAVKNSEAVSVQDEDSPTD